MSPRPTGIADPSPAAAELPFDGCSPPIGIGTRASTNVPDWNRIRVDFEAGQIAVREIARSEGVSDTAIHKRAKAEGWERAPESGLHPSANRFAPPLQTEVPTSLQPAEDDEFRWEPENRDIIVPDQAALAIYVNRWDQIVIREERSWDRDEDWYIRISRENLSAVIKRLQAIQRGEG
jgi:hypothetical protein